MDENNLVTEIYTEEIQSLNPYDISYIAMKNGSIIMVIDKTPPMMNRVNNYYYQEEKKDAISVYYFKVKYPASKKSFVKIGNEVYIAGSLKQNILNDEVYISAENIMLVKEASNTLENE